MNDPIDARILRSLVRESQREEPETPAWDDLEARLFARLGRRSDAYAAWLEIALRGGPGAALAWLHVARHREHKERDIAGALAACQQAAAVCERARLWDRPMGVIEVDLERRMARLRRKSFALRTLGRAA